MTRFVTFPTSAFTGDNLAAGEYTVRVFDSTSLTPLPNGVARRAFVLQNPSPSFTPASSGLSRTYYRRANATSVDTTTATWTGLNIADITQPKLLIAIFGRTGSSGSPGTVNININGTGAQSMGAQGPAGFNTRLGFIIVDKPAGSTMDLTSISSNGNWAAVGEATVAIWGVSGGTIVSSGFDMKNLQIADQTYSATLNVPAGGMVFAVQWPRAADSSLSITTALSGVDIDASTNLGTGPNSRILGSRTELAANASYGVSAVLNRNSGSQQEMVFGAIAVGV
jgi:hypothetical protein